MDRNTVIGFVLIVLVLIGFSYLNRPSQEQIDAQKVQKRYQDSIAAVLYAAQQAEENKISRQNTDLLASENLPDSLYQSKLHATYGEFSGAVQGFEEFITLENELMVIKLTSKGGRIYSVQLKEYTDQKDRPLILFDGNEAAFSATLVTNNNRIINTGELYFEIAEKTPLQTTLRLKTTSEENAYLDFVYSLHPDDYMVDFSITPHNLQNIVSTTTETMDILWKQKIRQQEKGRKYEERYAQLYFKYLNDDVEYLKETKDDAKSIASRMKWIGFKDQYFSSVLIAKESFGAGELVSKYFKTDSVYLKDYSAATSIDMDFKSEKPVQLNYFFGPNDYNRLKDYEKTKFQGQYLQLEKLVPLGWSLFRYVNKWIIIPIFDWLTDWISNIGLAIFILTLIVKIGLFPLTYKSFMSSAKMRVMKPQIEEITKKYPGTENATTRQQKNMELYRQVGINPMSGCLPMLLQMPILLALFMFFPTAIELRHQSFLWAEDLATYDALIHWDFDIPIISSILGNHISLFCLLMSIVTVLNTKFTMDQQSTGQEQMPGMKLMMYFMPFMMFFFLNSYPAGLNYYYLVSTIITILQTYAFRYFMDEKALLAKLEANKKNPPKKKSGFMARLEEAQRKQQAQLKEQQKKKKR
jgi:YidC/Oxa1 family membrane protein insertase